MLILKADKAVCFDGFLQVLILVGRAEGAKKRPNRMECEGGVPTRVFLAKSEEVIEKKIDTILSRAEECGRISKERR
jgi:hypothetical protein